MLDQRPTKQLACHQSQPIPRVLCLLCLVWSTLRQKLFDSIICCALPVPWIGNLAWVPDMAVYTIRFITNSHYHIYVVSSN